MSHSIHLTRRQWFSVIISAIITSIEIIANVINVLGPNFWGIATNAILSTTTLGFLIWGFRLPSTRTSKFFNYYLALFPMLLALIIIGLVYNLQQIPELRAKIDPLFSVGLWFVVLSSLSSLVAIINTDLRIAKLEKKLCPEENSTPTNSTLDKSTQSPPHRNKLERASQIATIVAAAALVFAGVTLYYTYAEGVIIEKQFKIENIQPEIPSMVAGDVSIQNDTYKGYPFVEKLSISTISPHFLKIEITNIEFANIPLGNNKLKPEIFTRQIEKYMDKGVSNLDFDVPFQLTFDVKDILPFPQNTTWAGIPLKTHVVIYDLQNNTSIVRNDTLYSYLSIKGEYLPKTND